MILALSPVELLSGLYESFLSPDEQARTGAYYTPRHLAMLTVDQALATSKDPLSETIFDGACGSGILLTTAYRRLIALRESREKRQLEFKERRDLLVQRIFGSDINHMACRVTAFSLYLSLLEGLNPADIMEAQKSGGAKLPTLAGAICYTARRPTSSVESMDSPESVSHFLSATHPGASRPGAASPQQIGGLKKPMHLWPLDKLPVPLRDFLEANGRVCLILPIALFLGADEREVYRGAVQKNSTGSADQPLGICKTFFSPPPNIPVTSFSE